MALIQHIEEPTFLNKTWYYRVKYGAFENGAFENGTFNKEVGLQGITLDGEIGTYALMSIVMKRSGINIDG